MHGLKKQKKANMRADSFPKKKGEKKGINLVFAKETVSSCVKAMKKTKEGEETHT